MNIEELRIRVEEVNRQLDNPYEFGEGYRRCKKFIQKNHCIKKFNIDDIDIIEALKCLLFVQTKEKKTFDECNKFIDSFAPFFLVSDDDDIENLIKFFGLITLCDISKEFINYVNEKNRVLANIRLSKFIYSEPIFSIYVEENNTDLLIKLFEYFRNLNRYINIKNLLDAFYEDRDSFENIAFMIETFKLYNNYSKKEKQIPISVLKKIDAEEISKVLDIKIFSESNIKSKIDIFYTQLNKINSYIGVENRKSELYNKKRKEIKRQNLVALSLLENALNINEIKKIREIIYYISDDNLKKEFLKVIYFHNKKYYEELANQLSSIKNNSLNTYIALFNEYEIEISVEVIKELMNKNINDIRIMLDFLKLRFDFSIEAIIYIIKVSNKDILKEIDNFVNDGYLNYNFVFNNISIFDCNSNYLNVIKNNIATINDKGINPKIFNLNCELLLDNSDLISKNIDILIEYNLIKKLKFASNYSFLLEPKLEEKIDKYIEFGYINFLLENLDLLNFENISRLDILHKMNFKINDLEQLIQILNTKKFNSIDVKIDEYIYNTLDYVKKEELLLSEKQLNSKLINFWTYSFDGIFVSALKVKRMLENGTSLYDAIFYNMNLSMNEYNIVVNDINTKCLIKKQD